jgi:hypothetical protein
MTKYLLFYSKYSINSLKIIEEIDKYEYFRLITKVCIDNKKIREQIEKTEKKLRIEGVPSLVIIEDNGTVEQYNGENAFNWIRDVITQKNNIEEIERVNKQEKEKQEKEEEQVHTKIEELEVEDIKESVKNQIKERETREREIEREIEGKRVIERITPKITTPKEKSITQIALELQKMREIEEKK